MTGFSRTCRQSILDEGFVFPYQVSQHAFLCGDLVHFRDVDGAQLLDVDRSSVNVCLVVVLWVVFGNDRLLVVCELGQYVVCAERLSPVLTVDEHLLCFYNVKFTSTQETQLSSLVLISSSPITEITHQ